MSRGPIVVGTDGSPTAALAVDKAGELAQALAAPVHVVCVPSAIRGYDWPARITAQQVVATAGERLSSRGVAVQTHLPEDKGDAALALVELAESEHAQMIVVGNKGMTGIRRLLWSFPNTVSHQARCGVLIVPTQTRAPAAFAEGSVVVGTDGSSGAAGAVNEAIRLAKALGGELHVVSIARKLDSEAALATAAAEAANQGIEPKTHALDGDPADALLDVAEKTGAAIVVVGSKGMHADDREWFGNIPDKISHRGTASSVLIVSTADTREGDGDLMSEMVAGDAS